MVLFFVFGVRDYFKHDIKGDWFIVLTIFTALIAALFCRVLIENLSYINNYFFSKKDSNNLDLANDYLRNRKLKRRQKAKDF